MNPSLFLIPAMLAALPPSGWSADEQPSPPLPASAAETPLHLQATADAWAAFRAGDFAGAIARADACIRQYQKPADTIQSILEKQKAALPSGAVPGNERAQIDRYQILHDVATCLLIKAWALERQGRRQDAIAAYTQAKKYSHARASERPGEPYWSPAVIAAQQLGRLVP